MTHIHALSSSINAINSTTEDGTAHQIVAFYDRNLRLWTAYATDKACSQVAPAAYDMDRFEAVASAEYELRQAALDYQRFGWD